MTLEDFLSQFDLTTIITLILTIIIALFIYKTLSKILSKTAGRIKIPQEKMDIINNFMKIVIGGVSIISILGSLKIDITGLIAGVGIFALAVGFAAQTIISNLISGLFLIFERVLSIGDIIQVGDVMGKVINTSFRTTQLETVDGNIITIPNSILASSQLTNMTSGKNETSVVIEEDIDIYADFKKAKALMLKAGQKVKGAIVDETHRPFILVNRVANQWRINLALHITVQAEDWYIIKSNLQEIIKQSFDANKILPPLTAIARSRLTEIQNELEILEHEDTKSKA